MAFDVEGAKQAGYSDAEIAGHLASTANFDAEGARKAGYSDQEIIGHLAKPPEVATPTWNPVGDELGNIYTPSPPPSLGDMREAAWQPTARPAAPVDPSAPPGPLAAPVGGEFGDLSAQPWAQGEPVPEGKIAPVAKIGSAMAEGWRATPQILTPEAEAGQERLWGPIMGGAINTLYRGGTDVFAAGNALMYGIAEGANQITGDPRAGRDALMIQQLLPMASRPGPRQSAVMAERAAVAEPAAPPPPPRFVSERFAPNVSELDPRNAIRTLLEHDIAENPPAGPDRGAPNQGAAPQPPPIPEPPPAAPPVAAGEPAPRVNPLMAGLDQAAPAPAPAPPGAPPGAPPVPPVAAGEPGPRSVGAAASRDMTDPAFLSAKTPAQARTDFRTSVQQTVQDRSRPGETPGTYEDHTVYVPGVRRLESARVFDPEIAGNHDVMMDIDKPYETAAKKIEQDNHDILKDTYARIEGDGNSIQALKDQRDRVSPDALGVFTNERPVNAQPVVAEIRRILDSPSGKVDAVINTLARIEKRLYDKDGNLEVLPSQLYGARKNLTTIRDSKPLTQEGSDAAAARREIGQVQAVLDRTIGQGANGFSDVYLPQWAHYSRLIDQQTYLQSKTIGPGKITGANGNLTANGVQKLLEQIVVDQGKPGNSRAKTLTPEQLDTLVAIRNELAAMQHRDSLAKSSGSPTVKKAAGAARLGNPVMGMSPEAQDALIHTALAKTTGGAGNAVYQFGVKPILENRREKRAERIMTTTRNRLLNTTIPTE